MAKRIGLVLAVDGEKAFREEVKNVNASIRAMKSELKLATAEFEGQANSLESVRKKHEIYGRVLDEQKAKSKKTEEAVSNAERKYESLGKTVEGAKQRFSQENAKLEELNRTRKEAQERLQKMTQEGNSSEVAMQKQRGTIRALENAIQKQDEKIKEYNQTLSAAQAEHDKSGRFLNEWKTKLNSANAEVISAQKNLNIYAEYVKEAENAVDGCATSIDKFGKTVNGSGWNPEMVDFAIGGFAEAAAGKVLDGALGAVSKGAEALKDSMLDASGASSQLVAATGLSEAAAKRYQKVMQGIKGDNFGESYQDVAGAMQEVIQIMGELDDASMENVTKSAIALRDTFGMDVNEQIRAVDVMVKTMGVDASTAFDLIAAGAQNGLNRSGELADNIMEYGSLWAQAGFSAEEMFAIMDNGLDAGAFNLDKVNDYVKEFGNSLADGRIEKNIGSFSSGTQKLFESWKNGEASTSDVFYSVISDLSEMTNKQQALTVASEVWSALGEDNAMDVLTALDDVNEKYKSVKGTMEELTKVKYSDMEAAFSRLGNAIEESFITPIANAAIPAVTGLVNGVADIIAPAEVAVDEFYENIMSQAEDAKTNMASISEGFEKATAEADGVGALAQRLMELNDVQGRTTVQKQEMATIVDRLSGSIPELKGAYDLENDSLSKTNSEIEKLVKNYQNVAVEQALLAATQDLANQKFQSEALIHDAEEQAKSVRKRIELLEEEKELILRIQSEQGQGNYETDYGIAALQLYKDALKEGVITQEEFNEAQENLVNNQMENRLAMITGGFYDGGAAAGIMHASLAELTDQEKDYNTTIKEQTEISDQCAAEMENYGETAKELYGVQSEGTEVAKEAGDGMGELAGATEEGAEAAQKAAEEA